MKKHLVKLALHAVYFAIAVALGIYVFSSNVGGRDVLTFVLIYLACVAGEAIYFTHIRQKKPVGQAALAATLAVAAGLVAFILFLFIAYKIGEATGNRWTDSLIAVILFLAIEWPIRTGLEMIGTPKRS